MEPENLEQRLSRVATLWTVVFKAHGEEGDGAAAARHKLMLRYSGAVYRYLLGAVRDPDVAADLCQEFAVRFLRGDFRRAAPERGRFRAYLKSALVNLVNDHHRSKQNWPKALPTDSAGPAAPAHGDDDKVFVHSWREELLDRTWKALAESQPSSHAVLQFRINNPDLPSSEMAEQLTNELGKTMTAANVRKILQRAHAQFADLLLDEISCSLEASTPEELRAELIELDLLKYCKPALERRLD